MNYNLLQFNTEMTIDDILENNIARNFINNNDNNYNILFNNILTSIKNLWLENKLIKLSGL